MRVGVQRIISRAIKGRDEESVGGETDTQFFAEDLLLPTM